MAAVLGVLLIAALVVGVYAWRNGDLNPQPVPARKVPTITVKAYQAMVSADEQRVISTNSFACASFDDATCLPNVALADAATQQWLDDLNPQPPARFVAVNAVMRAHLEDVLSADVAFVAAFKARVADGKAKAASEVITKDLVVLERLAGDVAASSKGTVAVYTGDVAFERQILASCAPCQPLIGQATVSCQADQAPNCVAEIAAVRFQLETFIEDLVKVSAPDSLAEKDASLQADLVAAYTTSNGMENAVSTGDQVAFQTGLTVIRHALARVDADAISIAGSH